MGSSTAKSTIYLYAWIRATCACQILARLLLKNDLICCPWSGKRQSFGGQTIWSFDQCNPWENNG